MGTRASSYDLLLRVITRYYLLLHYVERKRLLGAISKNIWEFDWVREHHLITSYYPLLPVITCYYIMWREKDVLGEISKNFWEFGWVRAHHLITSYYVLLRVITRYYLLLYYVERKRLLGEISKNF